MRQLKRQEPLLQRCVGEKDMDLFVNTLAAHQAAVDYTVAVGGWSEALLFARRADLLQLEHQIVFASFVSQLRSPAKALSKRLLSQIPHS